MQSSNQFTIYSLNDVVTQNTAPSNPYKGQLWVDTSKSPPITRVYDGSNWKEQNGTDALKSNVEILTTKSNEFKTSIDGLTSSVSSVTNRVTTAENNLGETSKKVEVISSDVSSLLKENKIVVLPYLITLKLNI